MWGLQLLFGISSGSEILGSGDMISEHKSARSIDDNKVSVLIPSELETVYFA